MDRWEETAVCRSAAGKKRDSWLGEKVVRMEITKQWERARCVGHTMPLNYFVLS